ncbi:restriction endonuclease subunit S [Campylobacter upsaliensis]|uniref:restriction endonuclease subunit S n=1 Tax=Campylobacter upsaliensis TaxID=28080 RepID=UPI0022EB2DD1|nr:restriction endonuclease subunit S [Campylobacter upsaliensis]
MRVYKPSGIEWLGEIPQSWEIKPLQAIFNQRNEQNNNLEIQTILSLVKDVGVIPYEEKGNVGNKAKDDLQNYKIARVNDLVLNKMNAVIGSLGVSKYDGLVSPIYLVLYIENPNYLIAYYSYLFQTKSIQKFLRKFAYGIMEIRESIDYLEFKKMFLPTPSLQEQKEIAEFLDKKCEKIQNYINKKQKLITLLQEKKQALINEAVTKGLNPNIESKNSGIEYLGLIPHHWEVKKLKHICKINPQANETLPNNFVYIDLESVIKGQLLKEQVINKEQAPSRAQRILQKQDILFQLVRPYQRNNYIFNKNGDYVASTGYAQIRTKECVNFVYYALLENSFVERVILKSTGSNYPAITSNDFADLKIPLPPLQEQKQIANFLDKKCEKINSVIEKTKKANRTHQGIQKHTHKRSRLW